MIVQREIDGKRYQARIADGKVVQLHRLFPRHVLIGGDYQVVFDDYRSISVNAKNRAAIDAAILATVPSPHTSERNRPMTKTLVIAVALLFSAAGSSPATADDVSKNAGICAAYKAVAKKPDADAALNTATNRQLANNHGMQWIKRMQAAGNGTPAQQGLIFEAASACRKIGL